jgi:hypothetical protein
MLRSKVLLALALLLLSTAAGLAGRGHGPTDLSLIPYLKFKAVNKEPGDKTSYLEPGLLVDAFHIGDWYAARAGLHANEIIDSSDDSERASLAAYLVPELPHPAGRWHELCPLWRLLSPDRPPGVST